MVSGRGSLYSQPCYPWFPGGSDGNEFACNAGDVGLIPGWEDLLKKGMATHSSTLPGKSHGQRRLAGYSAWGRKESDMLLLSLIKSE